MDGNFIGIIGIILATVVLMYGAYKGVAALPLTLGAALVVVLTNQMSLWESFGTYYIAGPGDAIGGYIGFFANFFLIFASSALYAKIMEETGSAISIGYRFSDWLGAKRAILIVLLTAAVLTFGGISLFVVVFAMAPIIMVLFKEANLPRSLAMGALAAGSITFTMKSIPGSPQATNVVPTSFLGTSLTSGAFLGILSTILMFSWQMWYLSREEKKCRANGEGFTFMDGMKEENYTIDRAKLPSAIASFLPMIVVVVLIIGLSFLQRAGHINIETPAIVVGSMLISSILALLLNIDIVKEKGGIDYLKYVVNEGTGGAIRAIAGPAAIVGFGGVVQASPAFASIVEWLLQMDINTYLMAALGPSVISGVVGSSSGGLLIAMQTLGDTFHSSGADLGIIHRLSAMFAGTFDSLPHSTIWFLVFPYLGLTHKDSYKYVWWTTVVIPTTVGIGILLLAMVMYAY